MFPFWFFMDPDDPIVEGIGVVFGIIIVIAMIVAASIGIYDCSHKKEVKKINTELRKSVIYKSVPIYDTIYNNDSVIVLKKR